jgi:hypothetical protein
MFRGSIVVTTTPDTIFIPTIPFTISTQLSSVMISTSLFTITTPITTYFSGDLNFGDYYRATPYYRADVFVAGPDQLRFGESEKVELKIAVSPNSMWTFPSIPLEEGESYTVTARIQAVNFNLADGVTGLRESHNLSFGKPAQWAWAISPKQKFVGSQEILLDVFFYDRHGKLIETPIFSIKVLVTDPLGVSPPLLFGLMGLGIMMILPLLTDIYRSWILNRRAQHAQKDNCDSASIEKPETLSSNEDKVISILFLASDPSDASRLRLGEEAREIGEKLRLGKSRDIFDFQQRWSARPDDVSQALLDIRPKIVHFSGHGTSSGELCLEDKSGKIQPVSPEALAALFELVSNEVECVVLNACYSERQGAAIAQHINLVIGMNKAIGDKAAIAFAIGFYQALGAGRSIEEAYRFGCVQIRLQGIPEHLTPILRKSGS